MKAALNGVPQLGTIDGWWEEGYDGTNGWAIPVAPDTEDLDVQDAHDAEALYRVLEEEIVPMYYAQDAAGISVGWTDKMRNAIRVAGSRFTARRMLIEYAEKYYVPAMRGDLFTDDPPRA
jgi:starch phosphorylase